MILIDGKVYKQSLLNTQYATKAEFTDIANEMTCREQEAYKAMTDDDTTEGTRKGMSSDWMTGWNIE